jgi:CCR4-NOT transcription complex subunit 3
MKERCESELKREIKKLQKIREFMRGINSNPDVKDKTKAEDARKKIEVVS